MTCWSVRATCWYRSPRHERRDGLTAGDRLAHARLAPGCEVIGRTAARKLRIRAEIRTILQMHPPLLPPLTGKAIRGRLTVRPLPAERTVQWHISAIHTEAILAECVRDDTLRSAQFIP